jgi:hypothetical protein
MSINILRRVARTTSLAAVTVAASGVLESTGLPLSAAIGNATLNLASVQSETEKLCRRKMTGALVVASFRPGTAENENRVKPMSDLRSRAGLHSTEDPLAGATQAVVVPTSQAPARATEWMAGVLGPSSGASGEGLGVGSDCPCSPARLPYAPDPVCPWSRNF